MKFKILTTLTAMWTRGQTKALTTRPVRGYPRPPSNSARTIARKIQFNQFKSVREQTALNSDRNCKTNQRWTKNYDKSV